MPFKGFDTETMVGKGATLNIIHKTSQKGREYADITAIMPVMQGMEGQIPDRSKFVIPSGDQAPAPIQNAPVQQPAQPMQAPIQEVPQGQAMQATTQVTVDQPQTIPTVQNPVQQTLGGQFTPPASEKVPF